MKKEEEIEQIVNELEECACNPNIDIYIGGLGCLLSDAAKLIRELQSKVLK